MSNTFSPLVYVSIVKDKEPAARKMAGPLRTRWQPYRIIVTSGDNFTKLFRSTERYTNKQDAIDAAVLAFGMGSNVYLREPEKGNRALRMAVRS